MANSDWMTIAQRVEAIFKAALGVGSGFTAGEIPLAQFYIRKLPWSVGVTFTGGALFLYPVPERITPDTNASDFWGHGVQVSIAQPADSHGAANLTDNHDRIHAWREAAIGQFLHQRINGLSAYFVTVEPRGIIDPPAHAQGFDVTAFVLRCEKRKTRPTQENP